MFNSVKLTNLWKMKGAISTVVLLLAISPFAFAQDLERAKEEFTKLRKELTGTQKNKKSDILFLLDTSGSLSTYDFETEKNFVKSFLNTITVSLQKARVEVIPFGSTASLYIDGISKPSLNKDKCDLIQKLKQMPLSTNGFFTNTKSAFQLAYDVCLGRYSGQKRGPLNLLRTVVILITDGRWNFPYNDPSPIPIAQRLHVANVEVFAIGVGRWADFPGIHKLVKDPAKQAFSFGDFSDLDELSRYVRGGNSTKCFNHVQTGCLLRSPKSLKLNNFKIVKAMTFPKCCQVKFNKPHIGPLNSVTIGEDRIECVKHSRLLGVTIDERLSWSRHLTDVKKNFANKLNLLKRSSFLSRNVLLDLYFKIILPSVLYGLVVWGGCPNSTFSGISSP